MQIIMLKYFNVSIQTLIHATNNVCLTKLIYRNL